MKIALLFATAITFATSAAVAQNIKSDCKLPGKGLKQHMSGAGICYPATNIIGQYIFASGLKHVPASLRNPD